MEAAEETVAGVAAAAAGEEIVVGDTAARVPAGGAAAGTGIAAVGNMSVEPLSERACMAYREPWYPSSSIA